MAIKHLKPYTSSTRGVVLVDKSLLWKGDPERSLTRGKISTGGRNAYGRITKRHSGGGNKRKYRTIDFARIKDGVNAFVERIEYDPNRTCFIALIKYEDGEKSYITASSNLKVGDCVVSGSDVDIVDCNVLPLSKIPIGIFVHNVEIMPGSGAVYARSAGSYAQVVGRDGIRVMIKLRSGEKRLLLASCRAAIGVVSNIDHRNVKIGKAGRNRWKGIRPSVRGVAMNPVDHPHGGGEGKSSGGRHPVTPKGFCTKGKKTRKKNKYSTKFIIKATNKR